MARKRQKVDVATIGELLINNARVLKLLARYDEAEARLNRAEMMARTAEGPTRELNVLAEKTSLFYISGKLEEGLALAQRVRDTAEADDKILAGVWNTMGNIYLRQCRFQPAEECFNQAR